MGAGTSAEEFFLKSINVESIFEFVERTDYLFLYSIKECVKNSSALVPAPILSFLSFYIFFFAD